MRIMRMLALLNVAKSEVYLEEYKLSLTSDLVLLKWIISTMLEKKMVDLCYKPMKENHVEGTWIHSAFVVMGLFWGQLHARPIIHKKKKKKKEQPNGPKVHMKWKKLGRAAQIQKLWRTVHCLSMWDLLLKNWHATSLQ